MEKIRNGSETSSTIRVDLNKFVPGSDLQLVIFAHKNGKTKHKQTTLDEWIEKSTTNP